MRADTRRPKALRASAPTLAPQLTRPIPPLQHRGLDSSSMRVSRHRSRNRNRNRNRNRRTLIPTPAVERFEAARSPKNIGGMNESAARRAKKPQVLLLTTWPAGQVPAEKKVNPPVSVKSCASETEFAARANAMGAWFNAETRLWRMHQNHVYALGLTERVARVENQNQQIVEIGGNMFLPLGTFRCWLHHVRPHMDPLLPGNYWKTPFYWEPGCPEALAVPCLQFEAATDGWLHTAIGQVMEAGTDESDKYNVPRIGVAAAVQEVYDTLPQYFERPADWWRLARNYANEPVGFVLPVLFKEGRFWKDGKPQGTIFYMGVLPEFRGHGYALELVHEATRILITAGCWRIFCDTGTENAAMVRTFRQAGYIERKPWQRPLS